MLTGDFDQAMWSFEHFSNMASLREANGGL